MAAEGYLDCVLRESGNIPPDSDDPPDGGGGGGGSGGGDPDPCDEDGRAIFCEYQNATTYTPFCNGIQCVERIAKKKDFGGNCFDGECGNGDPNLQKQCTGAGGIIYYPPDDGATCITECTPADTFCDVWDCVDKEAAVCDPFPINLKEHICEHGAQCFRDVVNQCIVKGGAPDTRSCKDGTNTGYKDQGTCINKDINDPLGDCYNEGTDPCTVYKCTVDSNNCDGDNFCDSVVLNEGDPCYTSLCESDGQCTCTDNNIIYHSYLDDFGGCTGCKKNPSCEPIGTCTYFKCDPEDKCKRSTSDPESGKLDTTSCCEEVTVTSDTDANCDCEGVYTYDGINSFPNKGACIKKCSDCTPTPACTVENTDGGGNCEDSTCTGIVIEEQTEGSDQWFCNVDNATTDSGKQCYLVKDECEFSELACQCQLLAVCNAPNGPDGEGLGDCVVCAPEDPKSNDCSYPAGEITWTDNLGNEIFSYNNDSKCSDATIPKYYCNNLSAEGLSNGTQSVDQCDGLATCNQQPCGTESDLCWECFTTSESDGPKDCVKSCERDANGQCPDGCHESNKECKDSVGSNPTGGRDGCFDSTCWVCKLKGENQNLCEQKISSAVCARGKEGVGKKGQVGGANPVYSSKLECEACTACSESGFVDGVVQTDCDSYDTDDTTFQGGEGSGFLADEIVRGNSFAFSNKQLKKLYGVFSVDTFVVNSNSQLGTPAEDMYVRSDGIREDLFKKRVHAPIKAVILMNRGSMPYSDIPFGSISLRDVEKSIHDDIVVLMKSCRAADGKPIYTQLLQSIRTSILDGKIEEFNLVRFIETLNRIIEAQKSGELDDTRKEFSFSNSPRTHSVLESVCVFGRQ
ncbi:MAG: hypothetical protein ACXADH_07610 [Candidatus Kariarchaeaceae archaeon]|jgi:hypothetical protein